MKEKERIGFVFYRDWREVFLELTDKEYRELMEAILELGLNKTEIPTSPMVTIAMKLIRPVILRDWEKYATKCIQNRENGANGGRPKKSSNENKEISKNQVGFQKTQKTQMVFEKPNGFQENPKNPDGSNININNKYKKENEYEYKDKDIIIIESKDSLSTRVDAEEEISYVEIVDFYNRSVKGRAMPGVIKLTEKRQKAIKARVSQYGKELVFEAITKAAESNFCNGMNDRNWIADFDFVFNANKMASILEGKYDNKDGSEWSTNEKRTIQAGVNATSSILARIQERQRAGADNQEDDTIGTV